MLMRTGAMRGYGIEDCPRKNFWSCTLPDGEPVVVCNPAEVIEPKPVKQ